MNSSWQAAVDSFIVREKLPPGYLQTVEHWFVPLAEDLLRKAAVSHRTLIVGISGSQGSGKSTLAALLVVLLRELMGLRSINLSLDDFYHTHQHRQQLARTVHPLLATRGVPGTHDVELAVQTLKALGRGGEVAIPRFNKAIDDRAPMADWPRVLAPLDVVFLEGWCLCIPCEDDSALQSDHAASVIDSEANRIRCDRVRREGERVRLGKDAQRGRHRPRVAGQRWVGQL